MKVFRSRTRPIADALLPRPERRAFLLLEILPELLIVSIPIFALAVVLGSLLDEPLQVEPAAAAGEEGAIREVTDSVYALTPLPDGDLIVSSHRSVIARLGPGGVERWSIPRSERGEIAAFCTTRGVMGREDGAVLLCDGFGASGEFVEIGRHTTTVACVTVCPSGRYAATSSLEGETCVWDLDARKPVEGMFTKSSDHHELLRFSPDGSLLARSRHDTLRIVRVPSGETAAEIRLPAGAESPLSATFSDDSRHIATGGVRGWILLWDIESGRSLWRERSGPDGVLCLTMSPDGKSILAGMVNGGIAQHRFSDGRLTESLDALDGGVRVIHPTAKGEFITAGYDGTIRSWALGPLRETRRLR